ncbi:DUF962 domain-containing protein [Pseudoduganella namucuonensis]|uniref:DUF962 domain-containing protein n=1 Tax=Pseudoduganella namucuonensis TaxID=1035707 RepID=A0A1I7LDN2_9BURK|nr:DUF962 domain-containing protein [Pseudoduganella namucuonensis]SFV07811.1 hypothetical protein SAMN05216552_102744 [Pseudoduganella namucuonensis]
MDAAGRFRSFKEFYPFYLREHANSTCRRLHFVGSTIVLLLLITAIARGAYGLLWFMPLAGYGFAWIGHYFFEHNRPATFKYPLYSFIGDWAMYRDMLTGRVRW